MAEHVGMNRELKAGLASGPGDDLSNRVPGQRSWFQLNLAPRFTNLQAQLKYLYCGRDKQEYRECLIQPTGRIDRELIASEKENIDRVIATLGLKEMRAFWCGSSAACRRITRRGRRSSNSTNWCAAYTR